MITALVTHLHGIRRPPNVCSARRKHHRSQHPLGRESQTQRRVYSVIKFEARLTGKLPGLLMHHGRLSDPMDPNTKAVEVAMKAWKKDKTDANYLALSHAEFLGGIYHSAAKANGVTVGPYLPQENISKCLVNAGKKVRRGRSSLSDPVAAALTYTADGGIHPLNYTGPRDLGELWDHGGFKFLKPVRVGQSRIVRTRPHFREWTCVVPGVLDETLVDFDDLCEVFVLGGKLIGVGDWRPEKKGPYGKFDVTMRNLGQLTTAELAKL
jgi:hypothetical protein